MRYWVTVLLLLAGNATLMYLLCERTRRVTEKRAEEKQRLQLRSKSIELLRRTREHGVRYEVSLRDWGVVYGDMRWRWTIFDADRYLRIDALGMNDAPEGVEVPYMLGNAPTRRLAEAQALSWLATQKSKSVVLAGPWKERA